MNPVMKEGVRSYVIRAGRMTEGQRRALESLWPRFGLDVEDGLIDPIAIFGIQAPLTIEIGFGMGASLIEMAATAPERHFIGIEVHPPGVGHLLIEAAEKNLTNLRVFNDDGVPVLTNAIPCDCADVIQIFFPDPWHKKRHHKRRLISREFAELLVSRLKPGGVIHIATDWAPYATSIREVMGMVDVLVETQPPSRPETKYEQRGIRLGHEVFDLAWQRVSSTPQ